MVAANHGDKLARIAISHSLVRQFSIVGFGIMLSLKIYLQKVSQRLIIENFVPRNYLAIQYLKNNQLLKSIKIEGNVHANM